MNEKTSQENIVHLSSAKFLAGSFVATLGILVLGRFVAFHSWFIAVEAFLTVIALFIFGSIRYRLNKNALTYGAAFIIAATFWNVWWPGSYLRESIAARGVAAAWDPIRRYALTLHGLDELVHADTMLFILGLTFFVAVIAQTRLLESVSFSILKKNKGNVVKTVALLAAIVSFSSGILDGVSMIGLMIRTLVIILFLAKAEDQAVIYAVIISTVTTTVCGSWLAYGEPPNLIMKANLHPHLNDAFFLRYCLPVAVGSYFIVLWNLKRKLKGRKVDIAGLDILDVNTADVRFLQAMRHEKVLSSIDLVEDYRAGLGDSYEPVLLRLRQGEPLGAALVREHIPMEIRRRMLGEFVSEDMAVVLDEHYGAGISDEHHDIEGANRKIAAAIIGVRKRRRLAQKVGAFSFIPFIGFLIWHAIDHSVPLFWASFVGFGVAITGIISIRKMTRLALKEAKHEYSEYLFLFPLFLSITFLQKAGFFNQISNLLAVGLEKIGESHLAYAQFVGTTFLSAMLDNNVVADFAGRALKGLELGTLHLFAMAQIAGYALGGCWTHIGSTQSVVAFSFIRTEVDQRFTPLQWIKSMTPVVLEIGAFMTVYIYVVAWFL